MGTETQLVKVRVVDSCASDAWAWCSATLAIGTWHKKIGFMHTGTASFFFEFSEDATMFRLKWADYVTPDSLLDCTL